MTSKRVGDPQQWNLYAYVRNNPLAYVDPDGRELKLVIYNSSSLSEQSAARVGERIATKFREAGVKNVTVDLREGRPGFLQVVRFQSLPIPHSHLLELRNARTGNPALRKGDVGRNWRGHSAVDGSHPVFDLPQLEKEVALANVSTHEVAHDVFIFHEKGRWNIMRGGAARDKEWLLNPDLNFTAKQAERLRRTYNKWNEVEKEKKNVP